jgi:hypothetical protein
LGTRFKSGKEGRLRKEQRLGKIRNAMESEKNWKGRDFWKQKWILGKEKNEIEKERKIWKGVEIGRRRRKWILGKTGRLRIEQRLKREDDWEIGGYWEGRTVRNEVETWNGVEIGIRREYWRRRGRAGKG